MSFATFWKGISLVYSLVSLLGIVYNKTASSYNVATTLSVHSLVHFLKIDRPRRRSRCRRATEIWNSYLLTFSPLASLFTFSTLQYRAGAPCPPIIVRSTIAISRDKHKLTIDSLINVINPAHYTHHVALHALTYVVTWVINCNRANEFATFL